MTQSTVPRHVLVQKRPAYADLGFRLATLGSGLVVLAILGLIVVSTTKQAWPAVRSEGVGYVLGARSAPAAEVFGALPFIYGTMVIASIALLVCGPISVAIGLFLSEVATSRTRRIISHLIDLLAAIPSVVFGLWGVLVFAPWVVHLYDAVASTLAPVPVLGAALGPPANGKSFLTAGLILALMTTPITTSISREVFDTVPVAQKEAAYALGSTRWEMIRATVLPHSKGGIVGALMLGLGRAMGETIAVALVIGSSPQLTSRLLGSGDAMAAVIANQFGEAGGVHRAALIGLGVVLFLMTVFVNVAARAIVGTAPHETAR